MTNTNQTPEATLKQTVLVLKGVVLRKAEKAEGKEIDEITFRDFQILEEISFELGAVLGFGVHTMPRNNTGESIKRACSFVYVQIEEFCAQIDDTDNMVDLVALATTLTKLA